MFCVLQVLKSEHLSARTSKKELLSFIDPNLKKSRWKFKPQKIRRNYRPSGFHRDHCGKSQPNTEIVHVWECTNFCERGSRLNIRDLFSSKKVGPKLLFEKKLECGDPVQKCYFSNSWNVHIWSKNVIFRKMLFFKMLFFRVSAQLFSSWICCLNTKKILKPS